MHIAYAVAFLLPIRKLPQQRHSKHKAASHCLRRYHSSTLFSERNVNDSRFVFTDRDLNAQWRGIRRKRRRRQKTTHDQFLSEPIDSFLAGGYAHPYAPDAPAPHPLLSAGKTADASLRALRQLNEPYPCHGAAVFLRFCIPLTRAERLGCNDPWKEILRSSLTPAMLARNIRASPQFSCLLDWTSLDVTEGASNPVPSRYSITGTQNDVAYVNAGLFFEFGSPKIVHLALKKVGTTWFIDSIYFGAEKNTKWSWNIDDDELSFS